MLGAIISNPRAADAALSALGLSTQDIRTLRGTPIPIWSVVLVSFVVGGLFFSVYLPKSWLQGLREIRE